MGSPIQPLTNRSGKFVKHRCQKRRRGVFILSPLQTIDSPVYVCISGKLLLPGVCISCRSCYSPVYATPGSQYSPVHMYMSRELILPGVCIVGKEQLFDDRCTRESVMNANNVYLWEYFKKAKSRKGFSSVTRSGLKQLK